MTAKPTDDQMPKPYRVSDERLAAMLKTRQFAAWWAQRDGGPPPDTYMALLELVERRKVSA